MVHSTNMMVIYVDHHNQVLSCQGEAADVFGISPEPFATVGMHVMELPWERVVEAAPNLNNTLTVMHTPSGRTLLLSIVKLPRLVMTLDYLLVISRLDMIQMEPNEEERLQLEHNALIRSPKMKKIIDIIHKIANVDSTVLLLGESGVGKTMLARMIHQVSSRSERPFVAVNCGTLPDSLIEAELFGYEAGTFTGGKAEGKRGLLETAEGGTIFLDEIAELPYHVQSKLLEVLQENTFRKVGSVEVKKANIRIVAATNKDLKQLVAQKSFREDLYYRLHVVPLTIPPLRERREEIVPMAQLFVDTFNRRYGRQFFLSQQVQESLLAHEWPGNVRELENMVERMVVTYCEDTEELWRETIGTCDSDFPLELPGKQLPSLKEAKKQLEKELILRAYDLYENTYRAAEALQVDQSTIAKKLKEYRREDASGANKRSKKR